MENIDATRVSEGRSWTAGGRARGTVALTIALSYSLAGAVAARAEDPAPPAAPPAELAAPPPAAAAPEPTSAVSATAAPPAAAVAPAPPPPPPYSLPWQLRPVTVGNVVRSDTSVAFYDGAGGVGSGSSVATMLLGSYKVTPSLAPMVRLGLVQNSAPGAAPDGSSVINPIVGATYSQKVAGTFRLAGFGGVAIPIGMGGGSMPDPAQAAANAAGIAARSAMDNAMFAVNYTTVIAGAGFAYIANKLTIQAEATVLQLFRVKGNDMTGISPDSTRTNSTMGLHAGYFVLPLLSLGGEIRYQRWLSTPSRIVMGTRSDFPSANMDALSFAVGPRFHFKLGNMWVRPGISYAMALDKPNSDANYKMVQIDIPVVF